MHSDHRHPGCKVMRAALTVPRSTTSTWLLSGVRRSSGLSKLFAAVPAMLSSSPRWGMPLPTDWLPPCIREVKRPTSTDMGFVDWVTRSRHPAVMTDNEVIDEAAPDGGRARGTALPGRVGVGWCRGDDAAGPAISNADKPSAGWQTG